MLLASAIVGSRKQGVWQLFSIQKRVFGKNGDTFILTTNGSTIKNGEKIPKIRIENKETKGGMTSDGNLRQLLKRFKKDYGDSKLLIKPRIRNEYDEILTEFGY